VNFVVIFDLFHFFSRDSKSGRKQINAQLNLFSKVIVTKFNLKEKNSKVLIFNLVMADTQLPDAVRDQTIRIDPFSLRPSTLRNRSI